MLGFGVQIGKDRPVGGTMPDQVNLEGERLDAPRRTVGCILRNQREAHGLGVDDVKRRLRIQRRYLEAIEERRFEDLPGAAYVPAYLRAYARDLGLDPDEVLAVYNLSGPLPIKRPLSLPAVYPNEEWRAWARFGVFLAILFVVGTILIVSLSNHGFGYYLTRH